MINIMNKYIKKNKIYYESRAFKIAYDSLIKKNNGPWGIRPIDFIPDMKG